MDVSARHSRYTTAIQTKVPDLVELTWRGRKAEPHGMHYYNAISEDGFVGSESSFKELKDKLTDSSIRVIVIYGAAGSGKTALAKMVYRRRNDPDKSIQISAWVTLSKKLDTKQVLLDILRQVNGFHEGMENHDEAMLSIKLKEQLYQKRYDDK
jgi:Cdc6-like AAA superfamily ATPase